MSKTEKNIKSFRETGATVFIQAVERVALGKDEPEILEQAMRLSEATGVSTREQASSLHEGAKLARARKN